MKHVEETPDVSVAVLQTCHHEEQAKVQLKKTFTSFTNVATVAALHEVTVV